MDGKLLNDFSINLNAQYLNGMTPFDMENYMSAEKLEK